jgi:hypothetical protein
VKSFVFFSNNVELSAPTMANAFRKWLSKPANARRLKKHVAKNNMLALLWGRADKDEAQ